MSDEAAEPRTTRRFRYDDPEEAFKIARRRIVNNALRRKQQSLDLSSYGLVSLPPEINELRFLRFLHLRGNRLQALPTSIGNLSGLRGLYLAHNEINTIAPEIGKLTQLSSLDLEFNQLEDLPDEFSLLQGLYSLDLSNNKFSSFPRAITQLKALSLLTLENNNLSTLPREIGSLGQLETLTLDNNAIVELPSEIGNLSQLMALTLEGNNLHTLPLQIGKLQNLEHLDLDDNSISTLPASIGDLKNLKHLSLNNNLLTGIPEAIRRLSALEFLSLNDNKIELLPKTMSDLRALHTLYLAKNNLTDFPVGICSSPNLRELSIDSNQLTNMPAATAQLNTLRRLSAKFNRIEQLPPEIGQLTNLTSLELSSNLLKTIPAEIGQLRILRLLSLENNLLSELPSEIGGLATLERAAAETFARNGRRIKLGRAAGLLLDGNPLVDPYPKLIASGQPLATFQVLQWLRGELEASGLSAERQEIANSTNDSPPTEPAVELGPSLEVVAGKLDIVSNPHSPTKIQTVTQDALHRRLIRQVELLRAEGRKLSNQHPQLTLTIEEYADFVLHPLPEIDVVNLWSVGNALIAQSRSFEAQDVNRTITEPLEPHQSALLTEVSRLHAGFILGFAEGVELTERADKALNAPQIFDEISSPTAHVLGTLSKQRTFLSDRARRLAQTLEAALYASGWKLTRVGYTSYVTVRNFIIEIGRLVVVFNEKGGTVSGGLLLTAAANSSGMNAETFAALAEFLVKNSGEILSFAAPFPELRAWVEWIVNHLDGEKTSRKSSRST